MASFEQTTDPGHRLLSDFVALNDPAGRRRVERTGGYFVVEGPLAIERLLALPRWEIRALALLPKTVDRLMAAAPERMATLADRVVVAEADVMQQVVGFDIHRGALASVTRAPEVIDDATVASSRLLVVTEQVNDQENLGAIFRNAAAFGVDAVLTDPTTADPFYRRSVRVSLGYVLTVPTGRTAPLPAGLDALHALGVTTVALTTLGSVPLRSLDVAALGPGPVAVVVGAEGHGLTEATIEAATHRVRIPMADGVDSLNVATAAAVALHHLQG
ncbi:MAG: RNA methyltransferase [Aquihabitans sp.]